jgi:hypothetical protein
MTVSLDVVYQRVADLVDALSAEQLTFSRRSHRQIAGWDWTPTPAAQMIERFGFFGPSTDDQPVPAA